MGKTFKLEEINAYVGNLLEGLKIEDPASDFGKGYNEGLTTMANFIMSHLKSEVEMAEFRASVDAAINEINERRAAL